MPNKLQSHRKQRKLTQKKVAALLGVSVQSVKDWEHGRRRPTRAHLLDMSRLYNKTARGLEKALLEAS